MKKLKEKLKYIGMLCIYPFALICNLPKTIMCKNKKSKVKFTTVQKRGMACILVAVMIITALPMTGNVAKAVGKASAQDLIFNKDTNTYEIYTAKGLREFCGEYIFEKRNAILMNDIDLSTVCGPKIGNWVPLNELYEVTFDGNGKTISNLYVNTTENYTVELFKEMTDNSTVKNLTVSVDITTAGSAYGITSKIENSTIENCTVNGKIKSTGRDAMGFVYTNGGSIKNCINNADITANSAQGIASNSRGVMSGCINNGDITATGGTYAYSAGICGKISGGRSVENCINTGNIISNGSNAGGIASITEYGGKMANCYSIGNVTLKSTSDAIKAGLLCGVRNPNDTIQNCYYLNSAVLTKGNNVVPSKAFGGDTQDGASALGKSSNDMKNQAFVNSLNVGTGTAFMIDGIKINKGYPITSAALLPIFKMGNGSSNTPFGIATAEQLKQFSAIINSVSGAISAKLMENLDLSTVCSMSNGNWTPIGTSASKYNGTFYGNSKSISNLYINNSRVEHQALFGYIGATGKVSELNLSGTISANVYVAGIVADNSGIIDNCSFKGSVTATGDFVGGIVGQNQGSAKVLNCYNTASVKGARKVGGIIGNASQGLLENVYNIGKITGSSYFGGVSGTSGTIKNAYFLDTSVLGGSANGATSKTSSQMKSADFVTKLNGTGNAFSSDFFVDNNGYPVLKSEIKQSFDGGDGTVTAPYIISNANQLAGFRGIVNSGKTDSCAILVADIDLSTICSSSKGSWTPIGSNTNQYQGTFNGNDCTVKGLYINAKNQDYQGLFGYAGNKAVITHLKLTNADVSGKSYVGSVVGRIDTQHSYDTSNNKFSYLTAYGKVVGTGDNIGGIAGFSVTATNCDNYTNVSGVTNVGGVSGEGAYIMVCNNYGNITGSGEHTGGIAGLVADDIIGVGSGKKAGQIEYADNQGIIKGAKYVGGILGSVDYKFTTVRGVSNNGEVHGTDISVGGISGYFGGREIVSGINNAEVIGDKDYVGGVAGMTPSSRDTAIKDSYSYGKVKGNGNEVGSIVGYLPGGENSSYYAIIENCHYLKDSATGISNSKKGAVGDTNSRYISQQQAKETKEQDFHDGTVVIKLYKTGKYIGQKITGDVSTRDPLPVVIKNGSNDPKYVVNFIYRHYYELSANSVTMRANPGATIGELLPKDYDDCLTFKSDYNGGTYTRTSIIGMTFELAGRECIAISSPSFTVTIPTYLDFGDQYYTVASDTKNRYATTTADVKIEGQHLEYNKKQVRVSMQSDLTMASGNVKIPYTLSYGTDKKPLAANVSTQIALETGRAVDKTIPLEAVLDRSLLLYNDLRLTNTINFTINYEDFT